jgi:hypothetical protein
MTHIVFVFSDSLRVAVISTCIGSLTRLAYAHTCTELRPWRTNASGGIRTTPGFELLRPIQTPPFGARLLSFSSTSKWRPPVICEAMDILLSTKPPHNMRKFAFNHRSAYTVKDRLCDADTTAVPSVQFTKA